MLDFQVAGRRMFQSPGGLLLILLSGRIVPKKVGGETLCCFVLRNLQATGRFAPCMSLVVSVLREQALASGYAKVQPPSGGLAVYIYKKTQRLLCFLVAGRRIELRTS